MDIFSGIGRWVYNKVLMLLLLVAILTLINFVWYGITPLWTFITRSDQQYEDNKSELEAQIVQVNAERTQAESQVQSRSANRPSKLKFWKLDAYDAETLVMTQEVNRLQAEEQALKAKLLGLEKPSLTKYLQMFWLSFQKNVSMIWGIIFLVVFVPDIWRYLRKQGKMTRIFSTEPLEQDDFWFFHGRLERAKYRVVSAGVICALLLLALIPHYVKNVESSVLMVVLSFFQIVVTALIVLEITATVKRLHDINRSGKQAWFLFIPGYNLYVGGLLLFKNGNTERNQYGHHPSQYKGIF